jgi:hypothetical protein
MPLTSSRSPTCLTLLVAFASEEKLASSESGPNQRAFALRLTSFETSLILIRTVSTAQALRTCAIASNRTARVAGVLTVEVYGRMSRPQENGF